MYRIVLFTLLTSLIFLQCQQEDERKLPRPVAEELQTFLDLDEAIVRTPPSLVSITSVLDLEFREPVIPDHMSGTTLDQNPFEFDPAVSGHAKWVNTRLLRFVPDNKLPAGREVTGKLIGSIAFGEQKNVNNFEFSFKVAEQEVISLSGDFMAAEGEKNMAYFSGTITFAQPVEPAQVGGDLSFRGKEGSLKLTVETGAEPNIISFRTAAVKRTTGGKSYTVSLPGRYTADHETWNKEVYLSGIDIFRVLAHMDATEPTSDRPVYAFRFSDPIQKDTDLSGYVSVSPTVAFQVRTRGKYLYIEGDFTAGRSYTVEITEGFPSAFGTRLQATYTNVMDFTNQKPEIRWMSEGVYLPTSNMYKLQFKSVNVARAYITITEIYPQNVGFFIQRNTVKDLSIPDGRRYYYSSDEYEDLSRVGEDIYTDTLEITDQRNQWIKSELDLSSVFRGRSNSVFVVRLHFGMDDLTGKCVDNPDLVNTGDLYYDDDDYYSNPCRNGYYYRFGRMSKMLISSNIGLTVKKAENGLHVFATDVLTSRPRGNLNLLLYTYQNKLVSSRTTDSDGYALFPDKGAYIYGQANNGIALIKLNHDTWELNTFDIGGSSGGQQGTDIFMYADRGVHRPGDTVHLSAIVRMNRQAPPPKQPVILKVKNPRGQVVLNQRTQSGPNGHVYFDVETRLSDPTGNWTAQLTIGDQVFTKVLRIETVKPNRLKVEPDFPDKITAEETYLQGTLESRYLFGAPAAGLRAKLTLRLNGKTFSPSTYPEFSFSSPLKRFDERNLNLYDGSLNDQGAYALRHRLPDLSGAPGIIQGYLNATVYETGGSFTTRGKSLTIYPFEAFVGIKDVFEWGWAKFGEKYNLPIIVVDEQGNPVAGHNLKVSVYVNRRHWWWDYDRRDRQDFRQMESTYLIGTSTYKSGKSPVTHVLSVEDYGRHYVEVTDLTTGHQSGLFFYASRWGEAQAMEEGERNYLEISSDKNIYNTGDIITLQFESPDQGMALLTLEQGDRILHRQWQPVEPGRTQFMFPVSPGMIPNCYASISMIQPHGQSDNDLPMRLYGIKPLFVEDRSTRLLLSFDAPEELKPKERFTVAVTSASRERATYTLAVVDEGLLDLTDFKTPSAWDHFFQKLRLGITTLDNFDEILGALFPDMDKYFSIGGGEAFDAEREKRLDRSEVKRFKPVVLFREPVLIEPGQTIETSFTMPNYVGSVRIMMVAAAGHSYVSQDETVPVRQALMVLPTIPRVARPGDIFDLPVSVFAMDSTVKTAAVSVETSSNLTLPNPDPKKITFDRPGEKDTNFLVEVGNRIGADTITVKAASDQLVADNTVHLPVTSASPYYTEVKDTTAQGGESIVLVPEKFGLEGTNKATLAFSRLPDIQLDKRLAYLIRYPYGCIEQTVSSAFPQLYLPHLLDLKNHQKQAVTDNVNATIERLSRYQLADGFSFWPVSQYYGSRYSDWGTSYAGHFLITARELGYNVPQSLYNHWLNDARDKAKKVNHENHRYQTYRLFLLALSGNANMGAMNLLRENYLEDLDALSRHFLEAAYHLAGQEKIADEMRSASLPDILSYRELSGTYGSALRDKALITYLTLLMDDQRQAATLLQQIAKSFRTGRWYSTQETATAILAFGTYYKNVPFTGGVIRFELEMKGARQTIELKSYQTQLELRDMWGRQVSIHNRHSDPLFISLFTEGIPIEDRVTTGHSGIIINRLFYNESGQPITVDARKQGDAFWVVYKVASDHGEHLKEIALSSIFPSGWEIINPRMTQDNQPAWIRNLNVSTAEYMDIRDDRVNWFFDLPARRQMVFAIKVNPTFRGVYKLPAVVCEAMYSPEYYARIASGEVTVE